MKWLGWGVAIIMGVLYWRALTISSVNLLAYESALSVIEDTVDIKSDVFYDLSGRYERCLERERDLGKLWRRKVSDYARVTKINKLRMQRWQRKEKQWIQDHFLLAYKELGGLERSMTPYR